MWFAKPREHVTELGLSSGMHIADLGAGSGHHTLEAGRSVGSGGEVVAVDINGPLLERLAREAGRQKLNIRTVVADLEEPRSTALRDDVLDAAILSNTLFQVEKKLHVLSEAHRILKPGGKLLIIEWSGSHRGVGPDDEHVVSLDDVSDLTTEMGFDIERRVSAGAHHYGLIVRKR